MMIMDSRRLRRLVCRMVKVSRLHEKSIALEKHSLITADQPISDFKSKNQHVPKGFMAVYVGAQQRRFVIPTKVLSVPDFQALMDRTADEYGYEQQGGLTIPCDEDDFQELLAACKLKSKCKSSYIHTHNCTTPYIHV